MRTFALIWALAAAAVEHSAAAVEQSAAAVEQNAHAAALRSKGTADEEGSGGPLASNEAASAGDIVTVAHADRRRLGGCDKYDTECTYYGGGRTKVIQKCKPYNNCLKTRRYTDPNSCPAGFNMWVPEDWNEAYTVREEWGWYRETYLVGVYRLSTCDAETCDGDEWLTEAACGGCRDVAMNSEAYDEWVTEGTNRVPWTSVAGPGRPWFLRKTAYSQPNGDYTAGCWLTTKWKDKWDDDGFQFNDARNCEYNFDDYLCEACPAGRWKPAGDEDGGYGEDDYYCKLCEAGTFSEAGAESCTKCSPGTYSEDAGSGVCQWCPGGTYASGEKNTECTDCTAGKYSNSLTLSTECRDCPPGTSSPEKSSFSFLGDPCEACETGQISGGGDECEKCPAGRTSNSGDDYANSKDPHTECVSCRDGYISEKGGECEPCPSGEEDKDGHTKCGDCPVGRISGGGSACTKCPAGKSSNGQRTKCEDCGKGYFSKEGDACEKCPAGRYSENKRSETCSKCGPGEYQDGKGATECKKCGGGDDWQLENWDQDQEGLTGDVCKCAKGLTGTSCNQVECLSTTPVVSLGFLVLEVQWPRHARTLSMNEAFSGISGAFRSFDANSDNHLNVTEARRALRAGGMAVPLELSHIWSRNGADLGEGALTITEMVQDELARLENQGTKEFYERPDGSGDITAMEATYPNNHDGDKWNNDVCGPKTDDNEEGMMGEPPKLTWTVDRDDKVIYQQCVFFNGEALTGADEGLNKDISDGGDCKGEDGQSECSYNFQLPGSYEVKSYHNDGDGIEVLPISKHSYCVETKFCDSEPCTTSTAVPELTITRCTTGLQYDGTPMDVFPKLLGTQGVALSWLDTSTVATGYRVYKVADVTVPFSEDTSARLLREVQMRAPDCGLTHDYLEFRDITTGSQPGLYVGYAVVPLNDAGVEDKAKVGENGFYVTWFGDVYIEVEAEGGGPVKDAILKLSHLENGQLDPSYTDFVEAVSDEYGQALLQIRVQDPNWTGLSQRFRVTVEKNSTKANGQQLVHEFEPPFQDATVRHLFQGTYEFTDMTSRVISGTVSHDGFGAAYFAANCPHTKSEDPGECMCPVDGAEVFIKRASGGEEKVTLNQGKFATAVYEGETVTIGLRMYNGTNGIVPHNFSVAYEVGDYCDPSSWPDLDKPVCGPCKALVNWEQYGSTCGGYCSGIGLTCVDGWEELDETCTVLQHLGCDGSVESSDAICECAPKFVVEGTTPTFTYTATDDVEVHFLDTSTQTLSATYVVGANRAAAEYVNGVPVVAKVERCGWERPAWALRGVATFELGATAGIEVRALGDDEVLEAKYYHPPGGLDNKFPDDCDSSSLNRETVVEGFGLSAGERMLRGCRAKVPEVEQCAPPPAALVPGCWTERLPCAKSEYTYVDELPETRIFDVDLSVLGYDPNATNGTNAQVPVEFVIVSPLCLENVSATAVTTLQSLLTDDGERESEYALASQESLLTLDEVPEPEQEGVYGKACTNNTNAVFREGDAVRFGFELVEREPNCYGIYLYPWDSGCSGYIDTSPSPDYPIAIRVADGVSKTESSDTYGDEPFTHIMAAGDPNPFAPFSHELSVEFTREFDAAEILFVRHALVVGVIPEEVPQVWTVATNPTLMFLILRDPAGGSSHASLKEGSTISTSMAINGAHTAQLAEEWTYGGSLSGGVSGLKAQLSPFGIGIEKNLLSIGAGGGFSFSQTPTDVTVTRATSRHFDVGISFSTGISTSSSPYLAGQPSDVIVGGGANLRFMSSIKIFAKVDPTDPNGLCLGGFITNQFLPEQITTWVMSVYEIEKAMERIGAALADPNITKLENADESSTYDPRADLEKQLENWQTVLANYRATTIRDQALSVAEQLSRELSSLEANFQSFLDDAVKNGNDAQFAGFLSRGLDKLGEKKSLYNRETQEMPGAAKDSASEEGVETSVDAEDAMDSHLGGYEKDVLDRVNSAFAECVSTVEFVEPGNKQARLCDVYKDIRQKIELKESTLFGICDFKDGNPQVGAFCKRGHYRSDDPTSKEVGAFGALFDTTQFITFSGTTGLEFSWDIAESRGAELTSTHDAKVSDGVGWDFNFGVSVLRRRLESAGDRGVPGYAYPISGPVLAVSKKLLEVTPEALEEQRRRLDENYDQLAMGIGMILSNQEEAKAKEGNSLNPTSVDNPCRRRLDGVEMSDEERRLNIKFCAGFKGETSSSFAVSLGRAASKGAEHSRSVSIFLGDGNTQDVFAVRISQDAVYGTPIFTTMGGRSSCVGETGTTRRDSRVIIREIKPLCVSGEDLKEQADSGEELCKSKLTCECKDLDPGEDAVFSVVLQNLSPWQSSVRYLLRAVNGGSTPWDSGKYVRDFTSASKVGCEPGDLGSLGINAYGITPGDFRNDNGLQFNYLPYGQHEVRIRVSRPNFAPQCFSFEDLELEIVSACEDTDWDGVQEVYQYQTTMDEETGEVSVIHPKFVGRPVGDCELASEELTPAELPDESVAKNQGTGRWCYSDLNLAVGCTESPAKCWEVCSTEVEKIDGKEGPPSDIATSCPVPFIKAVEPGRVKCDVGELKAIDWEEGSGQCRCQNSCECTVNDLVMPDGEARTTTHLLTKDVNFPPKKGGNPLTCGLYTFTDASKARGTEQSKATFDVSWKNKVRGCTYKDAENYNALATDDDLSCVFALRGCPYPAAANYNPAATKDDGSCVFTMPRSLTCDAELPEKAYSSACRVADGIFIRSYGVTNDEFWKGLPPTKESCEAKHGINGQATTWCPAAPFACSQPASCLTLDNEFGILKSKVMSKDDCVATANTVVKWCPFETAVPTTAVPTVTPLPTTVPTTPVPTVTPQPSFGPTSEPTLGPTLAPSSGPTPGSTLGPTSGPALGPTPVPTPEPTQEPTSGPALGPTPEPTLSYSHSYAYDDFNNPTPAPTPVPTLGPTLRPTSGPALGPTPEPTLSYSHSYAYDDFNNPTPAPTPVPTLGPTLRPTSGPALGPTPEPTLSYSHSYAYDDYNNLTSAPTPVPTPPTPVPTLQPTPQPTCKETFMPTQARVSGCKYKAATNFNPLATVDDDSCVFATSGCTYQAALNYNSKATVDDGSCIFAPVCKPCSDDAECELDEFCKFKDGGGRKLRFGSIQQEGCCRAR